MARVNIAPMPLWVRALPKRLRPMPPPIFDGTPTPEDIALARDLFAALDPESQRWRDSSLFHDLIQHDHDCND